jgi:hypothetical protein
MARSGRGVPHLGELRWAAIRQEKPTMTILELGAIGEFIGSFGVIVALHSCAQPAKGTFTEEFITTVENAEHLDVPGTLISRRPA